MVQTPSTPEEFAEFIYSRIVMGRPGPAPAPDEDWLAFLQDFVRTLEPPQRHAFFQGLTILTDPRTAENRAHWPRFLRPVGALFERMAKQIPDTVKKQANHNWFCLWMSLWESRADWDFDIKASIFKACVQTETPGPDNLTLSLCAQVLKELGWKSLWPVAMGYLARINPARALEQWDCKADSLDDAERHEAIRAIVSGRIRGGRPIAELGIALKANLLLSPNPKRLFDDFLAAAKRIRLSDEAERELERDLQDAIDKKEGHNYTGMLLQKFDALPRLVGIEIARLLISISSYEGVSGVPSAAKVPTLKKSPKKELPSA